MSELKKHNAFDEAIKNKIDQHEVDGTIELWAEIEANIAQFDEKKKRKFVYFIWFGALSLAIVGLGLVLFNVDFSTYKMQSHSSFIKTNANTNQQTKKRHTIIVETKNVESIKKNTANQLKANLEIQDKNVENLNNNISSTNPNSKDLKNTIDPSIYPKTTRADLSINKDLKNVFINVDRDKKYSVKDTIKQEIKTETMVTDTVVYDNQIKGRTIAEKNIKPLENKEENFNLSNNQGREENRNDTSQTNIEITQENTIETQKKDSTNKPIKKKYPFYIEIAGQMIQTSAIYKNTNLMNGQDDEIELAEGFGISAQFGFALNKRIELFSGLNFEKTELEQRLRTDNENFDFQTAFGLVHIEEDENDNGDDFFFVERYFYYLELPIGIRYNFIAQNKWNVNIRGEFLSNYIVNQSNRNKTYIKLDNSVDLNRITFSTAFSLGVQYNLKKQFSIVSDFRYNLMLNSISMEKNTIIKPYSIGFGIGLKKYF